MSLGVKIDGETVETVTDLVLGGSKITEDGDCSHEFKKMLAPWKKSYDQPSSVQFSSVTQSCPTLCNPWIAARQASLSITNSQSLLKLMSFESVMPSSHLILCRPLLLLPSIFPSIRVFLNELVLCSRWPKYWSFSFSRSLVLVF